MVSKVLYSAVIMVAIAILAPGADGDGDWRHEALDAHNKFRAKHGSPALVLDDTLNDSAQKCADYLAKLKKMGHICGKDLFGDKEIGENLLSGMGKGPSKAVLDATNVWYAEEAKHDYNKDDFQHPSGHFSQLIWKGTARMGVGYAKNGNFEIVVAHYDPTGNYGGEFLANVKKPV